MSFPLACRPWAEGTRKLSPSIICLKASANASPRENYTRDTFPPPFPVSRDHVVAATVFQKKKRLFIFARICNSLDCRRMSVVAINSFCLINYALLLRNSLPHLGQRLPAPEPSSCHPRETTWQICDFIAFRLANCSEMANLKVDTLIAHE